MITTPVLMSVVLGISIPPSHRQLFLHHIETNTRHKYTVWKIDGFFPVREKTKITTLFQGKGDEAITALTF